MNKTYDEAIRDLFSLEADEPLPPVQEDVLEQVHGGLTENLTFPFDAVYSEPADDETDKEYPVRITNLLDLDEHPDLGPYLGLLCDATLDEEASMTVPLARIVKVNNDRNEKLIDAYVNWFWGHR